MALDRGIFPGKSRMHASMREFDWKASWFGPADAWPTSLRTIVTFLLDSAFPICLAWGPELRLLYNDAYLPIAGKKHPAALGARMQDVFREVWSDISPIAQRALRGESSLYENFPAEIIRADRPSPGWFTFSCTPVRDDDGGIAGMICICTETTAQVLMEQMQAFRLRLSDELRDLSEAGDIIAHASRMLGVHLGAARVGYLEVDRTQEKFSVRYDWSHGELPTLAGQSMTLDDFGPLAIAELRAGRILKVDDYATDERAAAFAPTYDSIGVRAVLAVPLVKRGRLCAVLRIHHTCPHRWTGDEVVLAQDTAERTWAALERAKADERRRIAEEELHNHAALQAFQLELSDTLRPLTDADEIIAAASSLLGRHLGVSRVLYAQVNEARATFDVQHDWTNVGVPSVAGRVSRLDDFGPEMVAQLRTGQPVAVTDVTRDERTAAYAPAYTKMGVRALLALPLVRAGRLSIALALQHQAPLQWKDMDIQRARETAERTWSFVEAARAQSALRAERDQSQYIFDSMTEGFAVLDPDCKLVQMNAEGLRIGRVSAEVIGRKIWEVFPRVMSSRLPELYHQVMSTGKGASMEYQRTLADEQVSWLEIRAYPALGGGLALFYRDIDERKRAEEKLREADRRKNEFLAMLAHELRNPLAPIAAAAELLSTPHLNAQDIKHSSEVITRQVGHMTSLVNDLLDMSRVTGGLVSIDSFPLDINDILPEALEQVQPLMEARSHRLAVYPAAAPTWVRGDRTRLVQVLANLLNNAAKYTPAGGAITVRVESRADQVAISVRDNGLGMTPDLVKSAFELFAQAKRSPDRAEGGLGIGLALVRAIVELHAGTVTATSDGAGLGSEFLVLLPQAHAHRTVPTEPLPPPSAAPELKVLIVDDNIDAGRMLAMLMKVAGHRTFVEHQPEHALELASLLQPDVCLLDIGLPGMDGNEVARRLRAQPHTAKTVLIAVTGYNQEQPGEGALAAEFDHHFLKPIETARLLALMHEIGSRLIP